ncbi:MAG: hypothetical protein M1374_04005 [Firmicutes bacterium]|nr:hypothetical protein [Bacillota bacterium]
MNKYKKLFLAALCAVFLASCSSTSSDSMNSTVGNIKIPPATAPQPNLPFNPYQMPSHTEAMVLYANNILVKNCMAKKGFPLPLTPMVAYEQNPFYTQPPEINPAIFGVDSLRDAEKYGYDSPLLYATQLSNRDMKEANALESKYSQEYGKAYQIALMGGTEPSIDRGCQKYQVVTYLLPRHLASENTRMLNIDQQYLTNSIIETQHNPIVLNDIKKWSSCMASHGYDVKTPPLDDRNPKITPLTKAEITEATIDYNCKVKVNMMNTWLAVESYYQTQIINKNPAEFQEMAAILSDVTSAVKRIVAQY